MWSKVEFCTVAFYLELYVAAYAYVSDEAGDLTFNVGDIISVVKSDGEWWTGSFAGRSGIFPANFVKKMETALATSALKETAEVCGIVA